MSKTEPLPQPIRSPEEAARVDARAPTENQTRFPAWPLGTRIACAEVAWNVALPPDWTARYIAARLAEEEQLREWRGQ